jgi:hypothetical protein
LRFFFFFSASWEDSAHQIELFLVETGQATETKKSAIIIKEFFFIAIKNKVALGSLSLKDQAITKEKY